MHVCILSKEKKIVEEKIVELTLKRKGETGAITRESVSSMLYNYFLYIVALN